MTFARTSYHLGHATELARFLAPRPYRLCLGSELSLRFATVGTAGASSCVIRPVTNKKRSNDRKAVTMLLTSATPRRLA